MLYTYHSSSTSTHTSPFSSSNYHLISHPTFLSFILAVPLSYLLFLYPMFFYSPLFSLQISSSSYTCHLPRSIPSPSLIISHFFPLIISPFFLFIPSTFPPPTLYLSFLTHSPPFLSSTQFFTSSPLPLLPPFLSSLRNHPLYLSDPVAPLCLLPLTSPPSTLPLLTLSS